MQTNKSVYHITLILKMYSWCANGSGEVADKSESESVQGSAVCL